MIFVIQYVLFVIILYLLENKISIKKSQEYSDTYG